MHGCRDCTSRADDHRPSIMRTQEAHHVSLTVPADVFVERYDWCAAGFGPALGRIQPERRSCSGVHRFGLFERSGRRRRSHGTLRFTVNRTNSTTRTGRRARRQSPCSASMLDALMTLADRAMSDLTVAAIGSGPANCSSIPRRSTRFDACRVRTAHTSQRRRFAATAKTRLSAECRSRPQVRRRRRGSATRWCSDP